MILRRTRLTAWCVAKTVIAIAAVTAVLNCAPAQTPASSEHPKAATETTPANGLADSTPAASSPPPSAEAIRQARLVADTARLYKLAQELKIEVDKSSKDTMSLAVIKKAAEVEALARDLKERLKAATPKASN